MSDTLETVVTPRTQSNTSTFDGRAHPAQPLRICVEHALNNYFSNLSEASKPTELYDLVIAEIEAPLLDFILRQTRGNQTKAAQMLGLSRGTLRKLLKKYNLD